MTVWYRRLVWLATGLTLIVVVLGAYVRLSDAGRRPVVAIAGNHDSPGLFDALAPFLSGAGIHLVGSIKRPEAGGVLDLDEALGHAGAGGRWFPTAAALERSAVSFIFLRIVRPRKPNSPGLNQPAKSPMPTGSSPVLSSIGAVYPRTSSAFSIAVEMIARASSALAMFGANPPSSPTLMPMRYWMRSSSERSRSRSGMFDWIVIAHRTASAAAVGNPVSVLFNKRVRVLYRDGEIQL